MSLPQNFGGWLTLLIQLLLVLAPPSWLIWRLLSTISAHSICLSGQRISRNESQPTVAYRFAIQNNEDVPLTGKRRLAIQILDAAGRFSEQRKPKIFVGCSAVHARMDDDFKVWTMTFDELPAYDTWSIECETNKQSRNISLSIEEVDGSATESADGALAGVPRLSHNRLTLYGDQTSVFEGHRTTPEAGWATTAVGLALGGYCCALYFFVYQRYEHLSYWDAAPAIVIVGFGFGLWLVTRRPAPSISQGYWKAISVDRDTPA